MKREFGSRRMSGKPQSLTARRLRRRRPGKEIFPRSQTGGRGQYAHVELEIEARHRAKVRFREEIKGGQFRASSLSLPNRAFTMLWNVAISPAMTWLTSGSAWSMAAFMKLIGRARLHYRGSLAFQDAVKKAKAGSARTYHAGLK